MPTNIPLPAPHPDPAPQTFLTGARPTPGHILQALPPYYALYQPPAMWSRVPAKLSMWGNSTYGMCVTSEELFAKACNDPEIFIDEPTGIAWARKHGYLNGADLVEVMDSMRSEEHTSELQSHVNLVCRLLLEKKKKTNRK